MTQFSDQQVAAFAIEQVLEHFKSMLLKHIGFDDSVPNIVFNEIGYLAVYRRWKNEVLGDEKHLAVVFGNIIRMYADSGDVIGYLLKNMQLLTVDAVVDDSLDLCDNEIVGKLSPEELAVWVSEIDPTDLYYSEEHDCVVSHNDDDEVILSQWDLRGAEHLVWSLNSAMRTRDAIEVQYMDFMDMVGKGLSEQTDLGARLDIALDLVKVL